MFTSCLTLWKFLILLSLLSSHAALAAFSTINFNAERIELEGVVIDDLAGTLDRNGQLNVRADRLSLDGRSEKLRSIQLNCPQMISGDDEFCLRGQWSTEVLGVHKDGAGHRVGGTLSAANFDDATFNLMTALALDGLDVTVNLQSKESGVDLKIAWDNETLDQIAGFSIVPGEISWISRGTSSGQASFSWPAVGEAGVRYDIEFGDLSLDSPSGRFAAEALSLKIHGSITMGLTVSGSANGHISGGELLVDDFYRNFSDAALSLEARPTIKDSVLEFARIIVTDNSALHLEADAVYDLNAAENALTFNISRLDLDFPGAYERYIESVARVATLDGLGVTGHVSWSGDWVDGAFESGELLLNDVTIVDKSRNRFAVTGLDGTLKPGDHDFESRLAWRGLLLGRINLGDGAIVLDSEPGRVALAQALQLEVLGGQLTFNKLGIKLPGNMATVEQDLDFELQASLQKLDMEQLTAAMDWPSFSGDISGEIPAVRFDHGVLFVDGEIKIDVFDGRISVGDLSVERPFGVLPSLAANVDIHDLSLQELTQTFSFGQISGRLDGYLHDLRMLNWKPVAFDAWLGTPERQEKSNNISRQAVNHLTTLGGGSATAVLTGPILKMFSNFSYRRLGLGCKLSNYVCELRGISEDEISVLLMEGAGVPKIMIRAFNRQLDWPQLLNGLLAVSGDDPIKVGD